MRYYSLAIAFVLGLMLGVAGMDYYYGTKDVVPTHVYTYDKAVVQETRFEPQCYAGKMQLASPLYAPYFRGGNEPEPVPILWEGWVDLCTEGYVYFGNSYGPAPEYGGGPRPDVEPGTGRQGR